ncbi:gliding motility lipoprotein GldD [Aequorivita echinoideorum]|uniref:Gliding motility lipoprotein GldD n=1 Tax=Aequorivita echinoideorum TaxID=1549647 RepID=A0ABS5S174_9FLAO|nr:gliding motility lipoprotein GldD [Aequorivita echinoideorum]MBT0606935.1 gliding motility lipoprotein GldD [Aequorivita echinoideorum]
MKIKSLLYIVSLSFLALSCGDEVIVKPRALLRLDYPKPEYRTVQTDCPYSFEMNENATLIKKKGCGTNITYPNMKATLYLTYQDVKNNNLDSLLRDAQKLAYDHTIKANSIPEQPFINPDKKVYGMFYMINGNAATQAEFYVTDSINHFLNGALYFDAKPNFDSIYPAVEYLREDIRKLMETVTWE